MLYSKSKKFYLQLAHIKRIIIYNLKKKQQLILDQRTMDFKKPILIFILFYLQSKQLNALTRKRPLESFKKPLSPILPEKSINIVHYVTKSGNSYQVEDIPVKNFKINYNPEGRKWHAKSTFDDSYNTTGFVLNPKKKHKYFSIFCYLI